MSNWGTRGGGQWIGPGRPFEDPRKPNRQRFVHSNFNPCFNLSQWVQSALELDNFALVKLVNRLKAGEKPTPEEWKEFLISFHAIPSLTPEAFKNFKTIHGKNSYQILAETVTRGAESVLDLACGDGHLAQYLLPRLGPQGKYLGVDMAEGELEAARENQTDPRVSFVKADAQKLPFADKAFDHVVCHMALMLMNPIEPVKKEIDRILKPGGSFAAIVPGIADDDFLKALRKLSLDFVKIRFPAIENIFVSEGNIPIEESQDFHLEIDTNPDGVWTLMRNMYNVSLLEAQDKEELKNKILEFARKHAKFGRHLHFEFSMRLLTYHSGRIAD